MGGLCAGTMAYWSAQSPQWVSIRHVLARNTLVFLGVLLVVLPGITWMVRLGHLDFGATLSTWSRICLPIVATALVSTLVGLRTNGQFGTMAGGLVFVGMMMVTG